jgi:hypothetical protein
MITETVDTIFIRDNMNRMLNHCDKLSLKVNDLQTLIDILEGKSINRINKMESGIKIKIH